MVLDPLRQTLPNGTVALIKETPTPPAVTVLVGIGAGTYCDPAGREGTAALAARVLDRGTARLTPDALADELDGRGASLSVVAGRHQIIVAATCLAEDFDVVFEIVAEVTRRPRFDLDQVERRRAELVTAILQDEDDPGVVAVDALMGRLYAGHPYGRRRRGTVSTVSRLTRDDLVAYHGAWFTPDGLTVVIVGDVETDRALAAVASGFADWQAPRAAELAPPAAAPAAARSLAVVPMPNKAQVDIAYGGVGLRRRDDDYYAAWVMNNALGQYALGGRLGDSIRERQGMAYYVSSTLDASLGAGPLLIRAGVAPEHVERTIASIDCELTQVRDEGVTAKEFAESKQYLIGAMPRQLETNAGIAGFLLTAELFGLGPDHDAQLPALITAVTLDEVNRAARRLLDPQRATIVVAGPWPGPADGGAEVLRAPDEAARAEAGGPAPAQV